MGGVHLGFQLIHRDWYIWTMAWFPKKIYMIFSILVTYRKAKFSIKVIILCNLYASQIRNCHNIAHYIGMIF